MCYSTLQIGQRRKTMFQYMICRKSFPSDDAMNRVISFLKKWYGAKLAHVGPEGKIFRTNAEIPEADREALHLCQTR